MSPSTDPIGSGFVRSFAHPGGNITGLANMFGDALTAGKRQGVTRQQFLAFAHVDSPVILPT